MTRLRASIVERIAAQARDRRWDDRDPCRACKGRGSIDATDADLRDPSSMPQRELCDECGGRGVE